MMSAKESSIPCDLCGSSRRRLRYRFDDIDVYKCKDCGLVFVRIREGREAAPGDVYDSGYFDERSEYFAHASERDVSEMSGAHLKSFQDGLDRISAIKAGGRLLDVGCAVGVFLALAEKRGWDVSGVDISEYAVSQARKRCTGQVVAGDLAEVGFPDASFDVITLWDTVEHFVRPSTTIREVHRILRDDGLVLMDTPNEAALIRRAAYGMYRLLGGRIAYPASKLYHRFHLYYFSEKTLAAMLDKCGFEIVEVRCKSIPREKGRGNRLERALVDLFAALEEPLGMAFELLVIARKKR